LGDGVLGGAACDRLASAVLALEGIGDVREVTALTVKA
jgi:hypothetical protein